MSEKYNKVVKVIFWSVALVYVIGVRALNKHSEPLYWGIGLALFVIVAVVSKKSGKHDDN